MKNKIKRIFIGINKVFIVLLIIASVMYILLPLAIVQFYPGTEFISSLFARKYVNSIQSNAAIVKETNLAFSSVVVRVTFEDKEYGGLCFDVNVEPRNFNVYSDTIKMSVLDYYLHKHLDEYLKLNFNGIISYELISGGDYLWDEKVSYREFYENLRLEDFNKYYDKYTLNFKILVNNVTGKKDIDHVCYNKKAEKLREYLAQNGFVINRIYLEYNDETGHMVDADIFKFED